MSTVRDWLFPPRVTTLCTVTSPKLTQPLRLAVAPDMHNDEGICDILPVLEGCDALLIPGDILNRHREGYDQALKFLEEAVKLLPVFLSIGNHERLSSEWNVFRPLAEKTGACFLDNRWIAFRGIALGGLSSAEEENPDVPFLVDLAEQPCFSLLLCHHPEYYARMVRAHAPDLTLSGHAHGGQVCLWGRSVFAPGQGLFPKLTRGFYEDGHLLVSRGFSNSCRLPRIGNPTELIILCLEPGQNESRWTAPVRKTI